MVILFWISIFIIVYTYAGYGLLLYLLVKAKQALHRRQPLFYADDELPEATLVIAAFNEEGIIREKIENTLALVYPKEKIRFLIVTDGSSDRTPAIVQQYPAITLLHSPERKGKINAVHRAMHSVTSEIVIFTDANTFLNKEALVRIVRHYKDARVGAVAGEKRVHIEEEADATAGEGFYWKYESKLKQWDSDLFSVVGAAGELFSLRTALYEAVAPDTLLDDFMLSMNVVLKGYRIVYEPEAYAVETSSASVQEELKRKVRIAAGGIQSVSRLPQLFNFFRYPTLSFQYVSHRVLRWTITPFLLILVFVLNAVMVVKGAPVFYGVLLIGQCLFYAAAIGGWLLERREIKVKMLFIPYYFCIMNYAILAGIRRYFAGQQKVTWDKAKRKT